MADFNVSVKGGKEFEFLLEKDVYELVHRKVLRSQEKVKSEMKNAMDSKWDWTGPGLRQPNPRDIVDTKKLRDSVKTSVTKGTKSVTLTIEYKDLPYAACMYYGCYIQPWGNKAARPVFLPGRPWIDAKFKGGFSGVNKFDYAAYLNKS